MSPVDRPAPTSEGAALHLARFFTTPAGPAVSSRVVVDRWPADPASAGRLALPAPWPPASFQEATIPAWRDFRALARDPAALPTQSPWTPAVDVLWQMTEELRGASNVWGPPMATTLVMDAHAKWVARGLRRADRADALYDAVRPFGSIALRRLVATHARVWSAPLATWALTPPFPNDALEVELLLAASRNAALRATPGARDVWLAAWVTLTVEQSQTVRDLGPLWLPAAQRLVAANARWPEPLPPLTEQRSHIGWMLAVAAGAGTTLPSAWHAALVANTMPVQFARFLVRNPALTVPEARALLTTTKGLALPVRRTLGKRADIVADPVCRAALLGDTMDSRLLRDLLRTAAPDEARAIVLRMLRQNPERAVEAIESALPEFSQGAGTVRATPDAVGAVNPAVQSPVAWEDALAPLLSQILSSSRTGLRERLLCALHRLDALAPSVAGEVPAAPAPVPRPPARGRRRS